MIKQQPILKFTNVSKYFGGLRVIHELSFDVPIGGRVGLIGPNGAGKSTIFNLINGVYPVSSGTITLDGTDVTDMPARQRVFHGVSRSFQNVRLMRQLTVLENLIIGQHMRATSLVELFSPFALRQNGKWKQQAKEALEIHDLGQYGHELISALPYGIRKRVDLVRASIAEPKILLLDEPAAGLNASETEDLRKQLFDISSRGVTLLVVEHDMHFVDQLCDHVVVVNFGEKIAEGSMSDIRSDQKVREAYLGVPDDEVTSNVA